MTIIEAINRIDALKPNTYAEREKVFWLSLIDETIKREIIDTHEGAEAVTFTGYDEDTDMNTVLLAPSPYDELYLYWLESKIDYYNGETGKFNNSITMFNHMYEAYERFYNREHMPLKRNRRFLF